MTSQTFRDLSVWQEAADLVLAVYDVTGTLPMSEIGGLVIELRQAAVNVPGRIANGHGRGDPRAFMDLLAIARESLVEVTASLELIMRHSYAARSRSSPCSLVPHRSTGNCSPFTMPSPSGFKRIRFLCDHSV